MMRCVHDGFATSQADVFVLHVIAFHASRSTQEEIGGAIIHALEAPAA